MEDIKELINQLSEEQKKEILKQFSDLELIRELENRDYIVKYN